MHYGVVRTFTDVAHVPQLGKNVVSVGTLADSVCEIVFRDGVVKVTKDSSVIRKGKKGRNNLYMLEGNTMMGGSSLSSAGHDSNLIGGVASTDHESDLTNMWHMRLGHVSELDLAVLFKRNILSGIETCKVTFARTVSMISNAR